MSQAFRSFAAFALSCLWLSAAFGQGPATGPAEQQSVKINTNEVLLDILVKDKKDRPVRDLKAEELEIYEDGVKQRFDGFRLITFQTEKNPGEKNSEASLAGATSLQQFNLVTMVFDHFDAIRNQSARSAALSYIDNTLNPHMLVRVMVASSKLFVIEQFTNDAKKLHQAIMKATTPSDKALNEASERVIAQLKSLPATDGIEAKLASLTLTTLEQAEKARQANQASTAIMSLLHIARAQRHLPGRKVAVYFANTSYLPPGLQEALQLAVSEANRSNVSFYAIDVTATIAGAGAQSSRLENAEVRNATRRAPPAFFNARRSTFSMFEGIDRKLTQGMAGDLSQLCEGTGGFVIDDSLDFNGALRRVTSELSSYYALAYTPSKQENDGKFRAITVKVLRPNVKAQTRSGYFAVPADSGGHPVMSYETPLLAALQHAAVPHDFDFQAAVLHHAAREQETQYTFALDAPLAAFIHPEKKSAKTQPISFSLLGLIKNEQGEIVQRFSETHPAEIPVAQLEMVQQEHFLLQRHFWLPPGHYTFEAALHDELADTVSAQRTAFSAELPPAGLHTSSLFLIKQAETLEDPQAEADNPLRTQNKLLVPRLENQLVATVDRELSFHMSIFPAPNAATEATARIELLRAGKVIASSQPGLSKPDQNGRIAFTAGLPTAGLETGEYQLRAEIKQGIQVAAENLSFKLSGEARQPGSAEADNDKVITSALKLTDAAGELTLSTLKESKPIDLQVETLVQETLQSGARMFKQLGAYTYALRKVRRVLDAKGRIREEEFKDYEAYPVKGRHALVQLSDNGERLSLERIGLDRKQATETLIKDEEAKQRANAESNPGKPASFWIASLSGFAKRNKYVFVTIDPSLFFENCEFSEPRTGVLEGRETVILSFKPRPGINLEGHYAWAGKLAGNMWIDLAERSLVRIEGQDISPAATAPALNFVYQQQRLAQGVWSPRLIRLNAGGNEALFGGLNWDAWFEFNNYKLFDTQATDVKVLAPEEKPPNK